MKSVQVLSVKDEVTGVVSYVAFAKRLLRQGEEIGILAGRVLEPNETPDPKAVVYYPSGTKIRGIEVRCR